MVLNPWKVQSIHDFNYFCCPECVYRSKEQLSFQAHAVQNHVLSRTFFAESDTDTNVTQEDIVKIDIKEELLEFDHNVDQVKPEDTFSDTEVPDLISDENIEVKEYDQNSESKKYECTKCPKIKRLQGLLHLAGHFIKKHPISENDTQKANLILQVLQ